MKEENDVKTQKTFSVSKTEEMEGYISAFSPTEKMLFWLFIIMLVGSTLALLFNVNKFLVTKVPAVGGSFTEGILGFPRFINPLLALSDADRDMVSLVYSGLLKASAEGDLVPDLALNYSISEDGLVYSFTIKENAVFHDGTPVTAEDIIFTIARAQDPGLKSTKRASWDGVSVEKVGEKEIRFFLKQPYAPFLQNTTLGILPKHIWKDIDLDQFPFSTFNTEPIGSGPYIVKNVKKNASGVPELYELKSFANYTLGKPYIPKITVIFYSGEEELVEGYKKGEVENINSISPEYIKELKEDGAFISRTPLPRIFAVFFNQNQAPVFANKEVREALSVGLDKEKIVENILGGYGTAIDGPIPPGILPSRKNAKTTYNTASSSKEIAREILERAGWEYNDEERMYEKETKKEIQRLVFSISTSNAPELKAAAEIIADEWENIGARVDIKIFETGDLNQNVIRPRKYDALLFGEIIGRELDLFAFWHSSQRNDPGLNIALYANITVDKLLEDARIISDKKARAEAYAAFEDEVKQDVPAVFLYSPDFIYVVSPDIKGIELGSVTIAGERFLNINEWHIETNNVWHFFAE